MEDTRFCAAAKVSFLLLGDKISKETAVRLKDGSLSREKLFNLMIRELGNIENKFAKSSILSDAILCLRERRHEAREFLKVHLLQRLLGNLPTEDHIQAGQLIVTMYLLSQSLYPHGHDVFYESDHRYLFHFLERLHSIKENDFACLVNEEFKSYKQKRFNSALSILLLNQVLYYFIKTFTKLQPEKLRWPPIITDEKKYHPVIGEDSLVKKFEKCTGVKFLSYQNFISADPREGRRKDPGHQDEQAQAKKRVPGEGRRKNPGHQDEEGQAKKKVTDEARSLAVEFISAHPFCLGAVPYENEAKAEKPLTMSLYVVTDGKRIPQDFKDAAHIMFGDYEVQFVDFHKRSFGKAYTQNSLTEEEREEKLSKVNEQIEKILHLFENRLNVTAVEASFKVVDNTEQEIPCVRVFVLEKGRIPVGETAFPKTVEEIGYELDVVEGYYQPALGDLNTTHIFPFRAGVQISVKGSHYAETLGGFLRDPGEGRRKDPGHEDEEAQAKKKVTDEARSLAVEFISAHPFCLGAVPYENEAKAEKPLTMSLYVDTDGKGIPKDFEDAAHKMFGNYDVKFVDFHKRSFGKAYTQNLLTEEEREEKLSKVNEQIEKILHLFEDRLNVTAVEASFKVVDYTEQEIPCVRVFVLEKESIPVGEDPFPETVKEIGYKLDVAEGYYQPALGALNTTHIFPLRAGAQVSVKGSDHAGTLGGFLKDSDGKHYFISSQHVLYDRQESSIVHPTTGRSRSIGDYAVGLEELIYQIRGNYWIDTAIVELKDKEVRRIESHNINDAHGSLYGFEEHEFQGFTLNGEIGDEDGFISESFKTLTFTKIGAATDRKDSGHYSDKIRVKSRIRYSPPCWLTVRNCIIVCKDNNESFGEKGDSGSLFFGNDGRAWGVMFGVHRSSNTTYCLASLLCKCLETLEEETGKNLRLWVREENDSGESPVVCTLL